MYTVRVLAEIIILVVFDGPGHLSFIQNNACGILGPDFFFVAAVEGHLPCALWTRWIAVLLLPFNSFWMFICCPSNGRMQTSELTTHGVGVFSSPSLKMFMYV